MAKAESGSEEWKSAVSRGNVQAYQRRRYRTRVNLSDLRRWRRCGLVTPAIKPLTLIAEDEVRAIIQALGGPDNVSEQEIALTEDFARLGVVLRGELACYCQGDRKAGVLVGSMASQRRSALVALGLQRRAKELGLEDYLDAKAVNVKPSAAAGSNGGDS